MSPIMLLLVLALGLLSSPKTMALSLGPNAKLCAVCAPMITNTGFTVINGAICVCPAFAVTGFPPGTATSTENGTPIGCAAQVEALTALNNCKGLTPTAILSGIPLGGLTLGPGVYKYATTANLAGTLTLDAGGNVNAQFIFQVGTIFNSAINSVILLKNGAKACNVFFCVESAMLGGSNTLKAVILSNIGISAGTMTSDVGGLFAVNGAITLNWDTITKTGTSC